MKYIYQILSYAVVIIIAVIITTNLKYARGIDYKNEINNLHKQNDSLQANIDSNTVIKQDTTISLYKKNEEEYTQIIKNKDTEIEIKDKQIKKAKNKARVAWITTGASAIAFIIILL
jgi:hypothetical protein